MEMPRVPVRKAAFARIPTACAGGGASQLAAEFPQLRWQQA